jgi:adenylosuccinate lyase
MSVHPIEFRYGSSEMKLIWSEDGKLRYLLEVEVALAKAEAYCGYIPRKAANEIETAVSKVTCERVAEIEAEIHHDIMAVVKAISEQIETENDYVHYGATSNDIIDTALALQLRDSLSILVLKLERLRHVLVDLSSENKARVCAATTYGMRFAVWAMEIDRHLHRLFESRKRIEVGQMTGAVGTQAAFGKQGVNIQTQTLELLGLASVEVATQIIQRDRHAEYTMLLANIATSLEKIFTEIRTLQRSEIAEISEGFGKKQVGSSTMPHKRNPIKSEQICGLARVIRSFVLPALENNTLWDERDLTNSSSERIIFPETTILLDHIIALSIDVLTNLEFNEERIKQNLSLMRGLNMSEAVMMQLTKKIGRQRAHEIIRTAAMDAYARGDSFSDTLLKEPLIAEYFSKDQIEFMISPENYIGTAIEQVERVVVLLRQNECPE